MGNCWTRSEQELQELAEELIPILKPILIAEFQQILSNAQKENEPSIT